jgi:hypothetical protein
VHEVAEDGGGFRLIEGQGDGITNAKAHSQMSRAKDFHRRS